MEVPSVRLGMLRNHTDQVKMLKFTYEAFTKWTKKQDAAKFARFEN